MLTRNDAINALKEVADSATELTPDWHTQVPQSLADTDYVLISCVGMLDASGIMFAGICKSSCEDILYRRFVPSYRTSVIGNPNHIEHIEAFRTSVVDRVFARFVNLGILSLPSSIDVLTLDAESLSISVRVGHTAAATQIHNSSSSSTPRRLVRAAKHWLFTPMFIIRMRAMFNLI